MFGRIRNALRSSLTTLVELVGFGCIVASAFLVFVPLGLFVLGLALLASSAFLLPGESKGDDE